MDGLHVIFEARSVFLILEFTTLRLWEAREVLIFDGQRGLVSLQLIKELLNIFLEAHEGLKASLMLVISEEA